jgi:2,4-dienoyl-CoA reductase-like NADH-dependent reductase (Old Yellow Enzyme family)
MTSAVPPIATPIELVTSVRGSEIYVQLAGRTILSGTWARGVHNPEKMQASLHSQGLDALAEAIKHAADPELWKSIRDGELQQRRQAATGRSLPPPSVR